MATIRLHGGIRLRVRPLCGDDGDLLHRLFHRLSAETVYRRFMSPLPHPTPAMLKALLDVDHFDREALVVEVAREAVGVVRYTRDPQRTDTAEIAIVVEDAWQGFGLGRALMRRLAAVARRRGIRTFHATMLGDNRRAARLLLSYSPATRFALATGELEAAMPLRRPPARIPESSTTALAG